MIQAINADMPYDQFLIEQIAGDLLPNRTQDQLVATGFLRNGMVNEEGAIVPIAFLIDDKETTGWRAPVRWGMRWQPVVPPSIRFPPQERIILL